WFARIHPGMTMRAAAVAAAKPLLDAKPAARMSLEERAASAFELLRDKRVSDLVLARAAGGRDERRAQRAARAARDAHKAADREARRQLHEANVRKSPDRDLLAAIFRLRKTAEDVNP